MNTGVVRFVGSGAVVNRESTPWYNLGLPILFVIVVAVSSPVFVHVLFPVTSEVIAKVPAFAGRVFV